MAKKIRKSVNSGNKEKVVKHYSEKPGNFEFYYGRCENPEKEWHKLQEWVWRRYPIVRRVRNFIKALADDFELKPQVVAYLEDCFRGYSPKMQISMFDTLHDYICYSDLITTGVAHVDRLVRGNKPQQPSPCQAGTRLPISQDLVVSQILRRKAS